MRQDPMDMFEELDELFDRLFAQMDREFFTGRSNASEYRTLFDEDEDPFVTTPAPAPNLRAAPEPVTEVHTIGDEVKVVAELPGATDDEIRLRMRGNSLIIDAGDADHHYHTTAALPAVDSASMKRSFKNGVLEVIFRNS
jgi:HSP20 family molecular chaperone IbpA